jgi:hypothetical protein
MAGMRDLRSLGRPAIPKLSDQLRRDLDAIVPSHDRELACWPCAARLTDGTVLPFRISECALGTASNDRMASSLLQRDFRADTFVH